MEATTLRDGNLTERFRTATVSFPESMVYNRAAKFVAGVFSWINRKAAQQRGARRLRVSETISLGEKRFVSILQVDGAQFLIGGTAATVSLLATLESPTAFAAVLESEKLEHETRAAGVQQ